MDNKLERGVKPPFFYIFLPRGEKGGVFLPVFLYILVGRGEGGLKIQIFWLIFNNIFQYLRIFGHILINISV